MTDSLHRALEVGHTNGTGPLFSLKIARVFLLNLLRKPPVSRATKRCLVVSPCD